MKNFRWFGPSWLCRWYRFDVKVHAFLVVLHVKQLSAGVLEELARGERIKAWNQGMGEEVSHETSLVEEGKENRS